MTDQNEPTHDPASGDTDDIDDLDGADERSDDGTFGGRYTGGPERPMWQLVAAIVGVIAVVGFGTFLAFSVFDGSDEPSDAPSSGQQATVDDFDRPDSPDTLGATDDGLPWSDVSGEWGIQGGEAVLTTANEQGPRSIATITTAGSNGTFTVEAGRLVRGWGLVFRYQGQFNYWYLVAQPDFGTYNLGRVVDGVNEDLGGVGLAGVDDGVEIVIALDGAGIEIVIDGNLGRALTDSTLASATGVGLLALGPSATDASWSKITADMVPDDTPQFAEPSSATTVPGASTAPTTIVPSSPAG